MSKYFLKNKESCEIAAAKKKRGVDFLVILARGAGGTARPRIRHCAPKRKVGDPSV
jgi:hypothetical protein